MEPLFLAAICGCNAGLLFREVLHEIYIPRIQRGKATLRLTFLKRVERCCRFLIIFFENGRWSSLVQPSLEGQDLNAEDQSFVLVEAGTYLTATRGFSAQEARICYQRVESLCHSLNHPLLLFTALMGQWRYSLVTDKVTATMRIAKRVHSLAQEQNDSRLRRFGSPALLFGRFRSGTTIRKTRC
jgi:hypothetical protein